MNDPFDLLRDQLIRAASPRRRRRGTGLAFLAASLVLSGSAAAAAVTLTRNDERSAPLSGTFAAPSATPVPRAGVAPPSAAVTPVPRTAPPSAVATPVPRRSETAPAPAATPVPAATRYVLEVMPDLTAGQAGWCAGVTLRSGREVVGGRGCGPAARPGANLLVGGALAGTNGLGYAVVGPEVARVDFGDGRRIVPRPDAGVPTGWRAAVANTGALNITLFDHSGRRVSSETHGDRLHLRTRKVSPTRPPDAPCAITVRGLRPVSASLLTQFPETSLRLAEPAFLSCATTVVYDGEKRYRAAVLLDANHPGARAPDLPATPRVMSGRRIGNAWLVVFGGTSARERAQVLDRLSVSRLP
jgi:hypothetical protein